MTDGRTNGQTEGGDCNIPDAFLKKRGDNYRLMQVRGIAECSKVKINYRLMQVKGIAECRMLPDKDQLEHIRWRAIANPHALEDI